MDNRILFTFCYICLDSVFVFSGKLRNQGNGKIKLIQEGFAPTDCTDILKFDPKAESGTYRVYPIGGEGHEVLCDMKTDNGGWVVFQKRFDGSELFNRTWEEYMNGFGSFNGEFWLGNRILHEITVHGDYELRIDLEDFDGNKRFAKYKIFRIGNKYSGYRIDILHYHGNAGDAMSDADMLQFTTIDRDQDELHANCSRLSGGGWWFKGCSDADLNGIYSNDPTSLTEMEGIIWVPWKGKRYSLKSTSMMIRQKK